MPTLSFCFRYYPIKCVLSLFSCSLSSEICANVFFSLAQILRAFATSLFHYFLEWDVTRIILQYVLRTVVSVFSIYATSWSSSSQLHKFCKISRSWLCVFHLCWTFWSWSLLFIRPWISQLVALLKFVENKSTSISFKRSNISSWSDIAEYSSRVSHKVKRSSFALDKAQSITETPLLVGRVERLVCCQ